MEKFSSIERVVGTLSETEKEQILRGKEERFDNQVFEDLKGKEREKTPEELEIISLVNEATNELRRGYGLNDFNIPPENIHVIAEEVWPKDKGAAFFNSSLQGVAMREKLSNIAFMKTTFHEMLHFKSYNAAQITIGENPELEEYRLGLTVRTRNGNDVYFVNLNESVTEEMTIRFAKKILGNQLFTDEIAQTKDIMKKYPQSTTFSGKPLFNKDTFYAEIQGRKSWRESPGRLFSNLFISSVKISVESFTYQQEREILNTLIDKILERNSTEFKNKEEIFEVFAKGMMTGNILPVGRLIESTFGSGTLRKIGELDQDMNTQEKFVNQL